MEAELFKYDVAFSFLAQDEQLALSLNDLIQDRVKSFIYSARQKEIAGTDGESSFGAVFGKESRLVVVLYRADWGRTPWTRIEETAIRGRAYESGYDFVKFIPLDSPPTVPKWLPKTQLWIGLERLGIAGVAGAIIARVQDLGGDPHEETVEERASRLNRDLNFSRQRDLFLLSCSGQEAERSFSVVRQLIRGFVESSRERIETLEFAMKTGSSNQMAVLGGGRGLMIQLKSRRDRNGIHLPEFEVSIWDRWPPLPQILYSPGGEPKMLSREPSRSTCALLIRWSGPKPGSRT